jgi:hypothetical protein
MMGAEGCFVLGICHVDVMPQLVLFAMSMSMSRSTRPRGAAHGSSALALIPLDPTQPVPFALLGAEETAFIFSRLPLKDLLTVTTCVCKPWRSLKDYPTAWVKLEVVQSYSTKHWMNARGLLRLLSSSGSARACPEVSLCVASHGGGFDKKDVVRCVSPLSRSAPCADPPLKYQRHQAAHGRHQADAGAQAGQGRARRYRCAHAFARPGQAGVLTSPLLFPSRCSSPPFKVKNHKARLKELSITEWTDASLTKAGWKEAVVTCLSSLPLLSSLSLGDETLLCARSLWHPDEQGVAALVTGLRPNECDTLGGKLRALKLVSIPLAANGFLKLGVAFPAATHFHAAPVYVNGAAGGGSVFTNVPDLTAAQEAAGNHLLAANRLGMTTPMQSLEVLKVQYAGEICHSPSSTSINGTHAAWLPSLSPALRKLQVKANAFDAHRVNCPVSYLQPHVAAGLTAVHLQKVNLSAAGLTNLRDLQTLVLDGCHLGPHGLAVVTGALQLASMRTLGVANMALEAADANALAGSRLTRLTIKTCGPQAAAFISAAANGGTLNNLESLVLMAPQQLRPPSTYGTAQGLFSPATPLPALTILTLAGFDLGMQEWARLTAPKLRHVELLDSRAAPDDDSDLTGRDLWAVDKHDTAFSLPKLAQARTELEWAHMCQSVAAALQPRSPNVAVSVKPLGRYL